MLSGAHGRNGRFPPKQLWTEMVHYAGPEDPAAFFAGATLQLRREDFVPHHRDLRYPYSCQFKGPAAHYNSEELSVEVIKRFQEDVEDEDLISPLCIIQKLIYDDICCEKVIRWPGHRLRAAVQEQIDGHG